mgnify:CR=1 FL=1
MITQNVWVPEMGGNLAQFGNKQTRSSCTFWRGHWIGAKHHTVVLHGPTMSWLSNTRNGPTTRVNERHARHSLYTPTSNDADGHTLRNAHALRGAGLPLLAQWCGEEEEAAGKPRSRKGRVRNTPLRYSDEQWSVPGVVRVVRPETRVEVANFVISALFRAGCADVTTPPHLLNVTHLDSIIEAGRVGEEFHVTRMV